MKYFILFLLIFPVIANAMPDPQCMSAGQEVKQYEDFQRFENKQEADVFLAKNHGEMFFQYDEAGNTIAWVVGYQATMIITNEFHCK